jgi:hypothetical protein
MGFFLGKMEWRRPGCWELELGIWGHEGTVLRLLKNDCRVRVTTPLGP